jgi:hypothetical protein
MLTRFLAFLFSFGVNTAIAQFQNVLIHEGTTPKEPAICIDPKNANRLVGGANGDNVYYSHDGGLTWSRDHLASSYGVLGDPCIVADTSGNFYYSHLSNTGGMHGWLDRIVIQKSSDGGVTWNDGSFTGLNEEKDQDKPWMAFDALPKSPYKGNLYVTWTEFDDYGNVLPEYRSRILCSVSGDGAASWSEPVEISQFTGNCIDSDNTAEGAVPAIGPSGEVYTAWSLNDTIWFDRSSDGGLTWLENDIFVAVQPGGWNFDVPGIFRCNGFPVTACDPHTGALYINWSDQRNGEADTDVFLAKSTDGGDTWSAPVRVNNDAPGRHNFFTWMALDPSSGALYFVFYDRRNYPDWRTEVYLAYSTDGGETFENFRLNNGAFMPDPNRFFGDYTNIVAQNGHVHPIWGQQTDSTSTIWTAAVEFPLEAENPDFFGERASLNVFPNPFSSTSIVRFRTPARQALSLSVLDPVGQFVQPVFENREFQAGIHEHPLDKPALGLPPGVYFLQLNNGRSKAICKILIL